MVIAGAGIAGAAMACALRGGGLHIAVVEASPICTRIEGGVEGVDGFDARVSAITPASQDFLEQLGAWDAVQRQRACAYTHMQVWDGEGTGAIEFQAGEVQQPCLGHIVENRVLSAALTAPLMAAPDLTLFNPSRIEKLQRARPGPLRVGLDDGRELSCALLVAADGALSRLRQMGEFETREWDYGHQALVCAVETRLSHRHTAYQRFMSSGPLAFLPLPESAGRHYCSIVWSIDSGRVAVLLEMDDGEFLRELQRAFENRLGQLPACSRRLAFPLRQRHALDYVQTGMALVGDAAHTIHPLAGQGVNLALQDVKALSAQVLSAHESGQNPGELHLLKRYQRQRKSDNLLMMAAMDGFKRLFEKESLALRLLRGTGMRLVHRAGPLKRELMRHAMGIR